MSDYAIGKTYREVTPFRDVHNDCKPSGNPVTVIITDGKGFMSQDDINRMYRMLGFQDPVKTQKKTLSSVNYDDFQANNLRFRRGQRVKSMADFLDEVTRFPLPSYELSYTNISNRECTVSGRHRIIYNHRSKSLCYPGSYFINEIKAEKDKLAVMLNDEIDRRGRCNKENF